MSSQRRYLLLGTADLGKPRTRILLSGLREAGVLVGECHYDLWKGIEDKSQVKGIGTRLRLLLNHLIAYPVLIWRYLRAPRHDAVFIGYMGHFDTIILWPFIRMRGKLLVWDAFLSLYDTIVRDRRMVPENGLRARLIRFAEGLACKAASVIVLDTDAHADFFRRTYPGSDRKLVSVWVGAEATFQPLDRINRADVRDPFRVLFYGQFIPLHGIDVILDAARRLDGEAIEWTIVGTGQEKERILAEVQSRPVPAAKFVDWIDYSELPRTIAEADACLGVFGTSDKAASVIPNKVFQIVATGRPVITRDSPAIREMFPSPRDGVWLVEAGSGEALAQAVLAARQWTEAREGNAPLFEDIRARITPDAIGSTFVEQIATAASSPA